MADTPPKILQAPTSPLWYHVTIYAVLGLALGLGVAFFLVSKDTLAADGVTEVFRGARGPLLQYRAEKGAWPEDFDLAKAPAPVAAFGFSAAVGPLLEKNTVPGAWRFTTSGPAGKDKPSLVFTPAEPGDSARRVLTAVDARLDDGKAAAGKFRFDDQAGVFTLKDE
jgi:hypothetical protein